jgi:hypothetical protein
MNKKSIYLKYIVDDLVSKTKVDNVGEPHGILIWLPFNPFNEWITDSSLYPNVMYPSKRLEYFGDYIRGRYGSNEEEYDFLFNRYLIELKKKVDSLEGGGSDVVLYL